MILLPLKDRTDASPNEPAARPFQLAPNDSAASHSRRAPAFAVSAAIGVVVDALAQHVDWDHGRNRPTGICQLAERPFQESGAQVAGLLIAVDEVGLRPDIANCVDRRSEGEGRNRNDISGANTPRHQRKVKGCRTRGKPNGVRHSDSRRPPRLRRRPGQVRRVPPIPTSWRA